jgi:hypothetical protein
MTWQVYKLPTDRIYATYIGGDVKTGLAPDIESKNVWLKYLPKRVLPFGCRVQCIDFWLSCISAPLPVLRYNNNQIFYFQASWASQKKNKDKIRVKKKRKNK